MYGHYFVTPVLVTPTGLRRPLTLLTHGTLFLLADILVIYQLSLSQARDRTYLTFGSLGQNAGLKFLPLKGSPNLTLEVLSAVFLGMHPGVETTKSRTSPLIESLSRVMLSSRRASLVVHQQM